MYKSAKSEAKRIGKKSKESQLIKNHLLTDDLSFVIIYQYFPYFSVVIKA